MSPAPPASSWIVRRGAWAVLVPLGVLLIAVSARIDVPMVPVPMSLQTYAVLAIAGLFGARFAGLTVLTYLVAAAAGLPVLASGAGGWDRVIGPTAGYLAGFLVAALVVGGLADRGWASPFARALAAMLIGHASILVLGVARLWALPDYGFDLAVEVGALPFLAGAVVKSALAAATVSAVARPSRSPRPSRPPA